MTIEQELLKATGEKPRGKKEEMVDYLQRVAEAVDSKVSEDDYDRLSVETQEWFTKASAALSNGKAEDIPLFNNAAKEKAQPNEKEETKVATSKKAEKKTAPAAKGKTGATAQKPPAKKAEKKEKTPRKTTEEVRESSAADVIKLLLCEHPSWTEEQVGTELKNRKVKCRPGRLHSQYRQASRVIHFLSKMGKLK